MHLKTIEQINEEYEIESIDILKLDCEGSEYEILGKTNIIDKYNPKHILLEYHFGLKDIPHILKTKNYNFKIDKKADNVGLIYASRA